MANKFKKKELKRSVHSGKIINGREAILSNEAVEYVKTLGYKVLPLELEIFIKCAVFLFLVMGASLMIPSASSQPFTQVSMDFEQGFTISSSPQHYIYKDQDYIFNFFVFNKTTGEAIDNTSLTCEFFIANLKGNLIYNTSVNYSEAGYWSNNIDKTIFNKTGKLYYGTKCSDNGFGGTSTGEWEVILKSGQELMDIDLKNDKLSLTIFIIIFIISGITFYLGYISFSALLIIFNGFVLLFNEYILFGVIILIVGFIIAFRGDRT